ncbi:MAG TPA: DUF4178 domain-containing protein [Campylobacterales bacterium]|nr:DUF4178 domain-containing protein [Campylobacterales bacterium]
MDNYSKAINCTQCGDALNLNFKYSKITQCPSCESTLFLKDESVLNFGKKSMLTDEETLLQLNEKFTYNDWSFRPIGKIRYVYALGFWEEWFVLNEKNESLWISVDEGNFVIEESLLLSEQEIKTIFDKEHVRNNVKINKKSYRITEKGKGICEGFTGELSRQIEVGEELHYLHLTALKENEHITLEKEGNSYSAYVGKWIDAYEIEREDG